MIALYITIYIILSYFIGWLCGLGILQYEKSRADQEFIRTIFIVSPILWPILALGLMIIFFINVFAQLNLLDKLFGEIE